jgi:hypothetical protein
MDAIATRRQTLTALTKSADAEITKSAAQSIQKLAALERDLAEQDEYAAQREALAALYEKATDDVTRRALKAAQVSHMNDFYEKQIRPMMNKGHR